MMLVHHDDAKREYAYGADSRIGTFSDALMAEATKKGWIVISMKDDWVTIFSTNQMKMRRPQLNMKTKPNLVGLMLFVALSAFSGYSQARNHYGRVHAFLTQGSPINVRVFQDCKETAQWLGVPLDLLTAEVARAKHCDDRKD